MTYIFLNQLLMVLKLGKKTNNLWSEAAYSLSYVPWSYLWHAGCKGYLSLVLHGFITVRGTSESLKGIP